MRFKYVIGFIFALLCSRALAVGESPQSFTLDGRLYSDASATTPLTDPDVTIVLQILNSTQDCIIYEETQTNFNAAIGNGYFTLQVGSPVGAGKRSSLDSAHSMSQIFSNAGAGLAGRTLGGAACTYAANPGDLRYLRLQVTPSSDGSTRVLSPNMPLNSVPMAVVAERAESLQGFTPAHLLRVNTSGSEVLSQSNLENIFSSSNYSALTALLAGSSGLYSKPAANGTTPLANVSSPASPAAGQMWYDSGAIKFYDGSSTQTLGVSGSGITSLVAGTGLNVGSGPGGTITSTGTLNVDTGTTAGQIVQVAAGNKLPVIDGSNLTLLNGSAINSGTIGGSTAVNTTGNISAAAVTATGSVIADSVTATGNVGAATVTTTGAITATGNITGAVVIGTSVVGTTGSFGSTSTGQLSLFDHATTNTNYITLKTPATASLTSDYVLTLPDALPGSPGQVLTSDTSGKLTWTSPSSGSVTGVGGTAPITITGTGAVPVVNVSVATTSTSGVVTLAADGGTTASTVVQATDARLSDARLPSNNSDLLKVSAMPANCAAGSSLTFSSPSGSWVCTTIPDATASSKGIMQVGTGLSVTTGTVSLTSGIATPGTYPKVTVDTYGRVTGSASLVAADIPNLDWAKVTTGTPTTLSGYGITDAVKNAGGAPSVQQGTFAAMPTGGTAGRLYVTTDTNRLYRDNGTTWDIVSAAGTGTVTSVTAGTGLTGGTFTTSGTIGLGTELTGVNSLSATGVVKRTGAGAYTAGAVSLTADVSGILPIANGGTNSNTALNNSRIMASSGGAITEMAAMTDGQLIVGKNGSPPQIVTMSGGATISNTGVVTLGTVPVGSGGTGASSFANYSVIASNGSGNQVAVPGATLNTMLQWTPSGPAWSSATYPASTTANQLLYSSANNVVGGLTTANNAILTTNGSGVPSWSTSSSDNFNQYALLAGRSTGQSLRGGTAASENLTLDSTAHGTKGFVLLNPTGGNVGIGTTNPANQLHIQSSVSSVASVYGGDAYQNGVNIGVDLTNRWLLFQDTAASGRSFGLWQSHTGVGGSQGAVLTATVDGNVGIGTTAPGNRLTVGDNSNGTLASSANAVAIGNATGNSVLSVGQSSTARGYMAWMYNATPADAFLQLNTATSANSLVLQGGGGKVGIGTSAPGARLEVASSPATTATSAYFNTSGADALGQSSISNSHTYATTVNATNYSIGLANAVKPKVNAGVTNSGYAMSTDNTILRNYSSTGDSGTLTSLFGERIQYGHYDSDATATPVTTNAYGLIINPINLKGAISNMYDIYLSSASTGGTVTSRYSVYQADPNSKNYFGSSVGIGTKSPTAPLTVIAPTATSPFNFYSTASNDVFSALPWTGSTYLSSGVYYKNGTWIHSGAGAGNALFNFGSNGATWYASNNGTPSWNVASSVSLWTAAGVLQGASSRTFKENFSPLDKNEVLEKINKLYISRWNYKSEKRFSHIGPIAEEFYEQFQTGDDDKHIALIDEAGVALAGVQGLYGMCKATDAKVEQHDRRIASLEEENFKIKAENAALKKKVDEMSGDLDAIKKKLGLK